MVLELHSSGRRDDEYLAVVSARAEQVQADLKVLKAQVEQLQGRRDALEEELTHLRALLGVGDEQPVLARSSEEQSVGDMVVALLQEVGEPLHYRDIEKELRSRGLIALGGEEPANALLARYFRDERLYRPARGTYALREWNRRARSVGTRRKRRTR